MSDIAKYNITKHLKEQDLEARFELCPFCQGDKSLHVCDIQEKPKIEALECNHCHIGYISRQPTGEYLNHYYSNYYDAEKHTTIEKDTLIKHLLKNLSAHITKGIDTLKVIDYGGGDGSIAYGLIQELVSNKSYKSAILYVVDVNSGLLSSKDDVEVVNLKSLEELPDNLSAHIVIASAILEHVKQPQVILKQLLMLLSSKGLFYARTPFMYPFSKLFGKVGSQVDLHYPGHLFDMGSKFWNRVLKTLDIDKDYSFVKSQTSLVETKLKTDFVRTIAAHIFKLPSKLGLSGYKLVGGWEVFIQRR